MRWKLPAVAAAAALALCASTAIADPESDAERVLYPATSVASVLEGLITDATDPKVVEYTLRAGLIQVVPRALDNHPELTDPATYSDPVVRLRGVWVLPPGQLAATGLAYGVASGGSRASAQVTAVADPGRS